MSLPEETNRASTSELSGDDSGGLARWLGEAKTNSHVVEDNKTRIGRISFKIDTRDLFSSENNRALVDAGRTCAANTVQSWWRERQLEIARLQRKQDLARTKETLRSTLSGDFPEKYNQAAEMEEKLCALTPMYLQWLLRTSGPQSLAPETCHNIVGAVAFVDMKGFTNLAQYLAKKSQDSTGSNVFHEDIMHVNLSSELTNEVLGKYWELVIMYAHKFQGSVLKFLGDAVQIIFPLHPLFSSVEDPEEAASLCQNRSVMFTLELLRALEYFEIASLDLGTSRMSLKIGIAYGQMSLRVVGGVACRCEFVLSGPTSELAAELSGKAGHDEAIVDESIMVVKEILSSGRRQTSSFSRIKVGTKFPKVQELYQHLTQTPDYFDANLYTNPYVSGEDNIDSTEELFEGVRALNQAQKMMLARAKERRRQRRLSRSSSANSSLRLSGGNPALSIKALEESIEATKSSNQILRGGLSLDVLGRFVPIVALSQIAAGCHTSQLGQGYCAVLFIEICNYDATAPEDEQTRFIQLATIFAQTAIYEELGDLRQVAVDDKGLVIIGMFGISAPNAEACAFRAAMKIKARYASERIVAALGISSGACHFGPTGAAARSEYAVVGSTVNLAARLMARASIAAKHFRDQSFILLDHITFLGLPAHHRQKFVTSDVEVKGFERAIQVFSPLAAGLTLDDFNELDIAEHLGFTTKSRVVMVSLVTKRSAISFQERQKRSGFVADIHRLTLGLDRSESVKEVIKHVAVMGVVTSRIDVSVLYSVISNAAVCSDLLYALQVLEYDLQILQGAGDQQYVVRSPARHIKPLYETLMQSFRTRLHRDLANIYEQQVMFSNLRNLERESLHVIVGSHYALAGVEYHLKAAEYLSQGLSKVAKNDVSHAAMLAQRSRKLVQGWQRKQQAKAENAAAMSMYLRGTCELKSNNLEQSFGAFVAGMRCYGAFGPLLQQPCRTPKTCHLLDDTAPLCSCLELRPRLKAYLFAHYLEQAHSSKFYLRGMEIHSPDGKSFRLTPIECANLTSTQTRQSFHNVCVLKELTEEEALSRYHLGARNDSITRFYQLQIHDASVAKLLLRTLAQLAKVSSMMDVKVVSESRSMSFITTEGSDPHLDVKPSPEKSSAAPASSTSNVSSVCAIS